MDDQESTAPPPPQISPEQARKWLGFTVTQLLEDAPLHSPQTIKFLFGNPIGQANVAFPKEIWVHCDHLKCEGVRRHSLNDDDKFIVGQDVYSFVVYSCANCTETKNEDLSRAAIRATNPKASFPHHRRIQPRTFSASPACNRPWPRNRRIRLLPEDCRKHEVRLGRFYSRSR